MNDLRPSNQITSVPDDCHHRLHLQILNSAWQHRWCQFLKPHFRLRTLLLFVLMGIQGCGGGRGEKAPPAKTVHDPVAALQKLGATIDREEQGEVIKVRLKNDTTDAGLEHLKGLTRLKSLTLFNTQITDAGLEHLKDLTSLSLLTLSFSNNITDGGLVHVKGLTNLNSLDLWGCARITGAG